MATLLSTLNPQDGTYEDPHLQFDDNNYIFVIFHNHLPFWGGVKALSYKPYFIIVNMYYVCALFCMYFCDIKGQVDFANHGKS